MSDLISRSALKEDLLKRNFYPVFVKRALEDAPAVDAVEVVRCRDCKWFKPYQKPVEDFDGRCVVHMCETDEPEFCSIGRRKDNEQQKQTQEET